jgi:hypothetical protein
MYKIIGADKKEYGPVTIEELRQWIAQGRANGETLVQLEGQTDWRPLASFPELVPLLQPQSQPQPQIQPQPFPTSAPPSSAFDPGGAKRVVQPAATALLVMGILMALFNLAFIVLVFVGGGIESMMQSLRDNPDLPPEISRALGDMDATAGAAGMVPWFIFVCLDLFVIFAALRMKQLRGYGVALAGAIISTIPCLTSHPCCCCLINIPIGIWCIIVLAKPEVRDAFR